jgi:diguanylate cyclase (GGDEF)-like protein
MLDVAVLPHIGVPAADGAEVDRRAVALRSALGLLTLSVLLYPLSSDGPVQQVWYDAVGVVSVAIAWAGLRHHRPPHSTAWHLVLGGYLGWTVGDAVSSLEQTVWHLDSYPVPSDAVYLSSYLVLGAGLLTMARSRHRRENLGVLLDAGIIAAGTGVVAGVFVLAPIVEDSSLTLAGKLVSSAYPLVDVLMLALVLRLWTSHGTRSTSFWLLNASLLLTLVGDVGWNATIVMSGSGVSEEWDDVLWLLAYVSIAAACWSPSMRHVSEPSPSRDRPRNAQARVLWLATGLLLPAVTLLLDGLGGGTVRWSVVGTGSIVLSLLVVARMANLVGLVQVQAVQLAALARSDGLTGAPNRRTWDHELSRACQRARDAGTSLCVAMIDLDLFKAYNDTHGHQAGDLLLRESVAAWSEQLADGEVLARYGGEEFAVLLPGLTLEQARDRLDTLRGVMPRSQTLSAGVARWDPLTDPSEAMNAADQALYDAKRSGRDRVCVPHDDGRAGHLPTPLIALQPIVDLATGTPVAVEALSRFAGESPADVFERAHRCGDGARLEAAAIRAALDVRPPGVRMSLNVSLASLTSPYVVAVLPEDLHGVVLEITEGTDTEPDQALRDQLERLRGRGAVIAIDDWGRGFSNLDRLLRLRPEMVKLDLSLVHGLESDYHRATIRSVVAWADEVGVRICAEGVETTRQREALLELGVHSAQGYLFGRPEVPGAAVPAASSS